MPMAAVLERFNEPLRLVELELDPPRTGEVRVRVRASGVCHSDLHMQQGHIPFPLPMVLGHEAAGVIEELGPDVVDFALGDRVILTPSPQCGACFYCQRGQPQLCDRGAAAVASGGLFDGTPRFRLDGEPAYQFCCSGAFAESTVVPTAGIVRFGSEVPFPAAALMGCAVATGFGAVMNNARVAEGDTVVVIGCGGIGMSVVQGARHRRASRIIAVDVVESKLQLALRIGATDSVDASSGDVLSQVLALTTAGQGADVVFEASGRADTLERAVLMARRGGQVVFIGGGSVDSLLPMSRLGGTEKRVMCSAYGGTDTRRDIPRLIQLYEDGELKIDELVSATIHLSEVNDALQLLGRSTDLTRAVIDFE